MSDPIIIPQMRSAYRYALLVTLFLHGAAAQHFSTSYAWAAYPNLSPSCVAALNSSITCDDSILGATSEFGVYLSDTQLKSLCVDTCFTSLQQYKSTLATACSASDMIQDNGLVYPASYKADFYISGLNLICRKDQTTGSFCSTLFMSWADAGNPLTHDQECSDCVLGVRQIELQSPFRYRPYIATAFDASTSSCQNSNYPYTTPTLAIINNPATSAAATPTLTPPCAQPYTVKSGDTCTSISSANNVSTFALLTTNSLQAYCSNFPASGTVLCLPQQCNTFTVAANQTCSDILQAAGTSVTFEMLRAWNPNINTPCSNLAQLVNTQICISQPGGSSASASSTSTNGTAAATTTTTSVYEGDPCIPTDRPRSCYLNPDYVSTDTYWSVGTALPTPALASA